MARRVRSGFDMEVFDQSVSAARRLERFLNVYVRHFSPRHRTDTNQLIHYMRQPLPGRRIIYFGLCFGGEPCGFCALMYYPADKIGVFDFMVIAPHRRGDGAFFVFTDLISEYLERADIPFDYLAAEILLDEGPVAPGMTPEKLIGLLRWQRFRRVKLPYIAPDPSLVTDRQGCRAVLMLVLEPDRVWISASELIRIIELIYLNHYLLWFRGVMAPAEAEAYERALRLECDRICGAARSAEIIQLNGMKNIEPYLQPYPDQRALGGVLASLVVVILTVALGLQQDALLAALIIAPAAGVFVLAALSRNFRRQAGRFFGLSG